MLCSSRSSRIFGVFTAVVTLGGDVRRRAAGDAAGRDADRGRDSRSASARRSTRPIKPESDDEIGQLTKTIDRLRLSMKAAMARLGQ